ncbi:hypothetical protein RFI_10457 [Reticulomyxa filosa]|uniref:Uncharacterized protein n=1 Tax=Reticulomyxa filosa TaxID=46433 RepID=X6NMQ3_RETFI|nr:hypothetical protein RFI_10457 [Reticulomyxa filosa]|eukprot:ETO26682.1 hypothetical protein RFI_10457 [Reticulomyxa filosa]
MDTSEEWDENDEEQKKLRELKEAKRQEKKRKREEREAKKKEKRLEKKKKRLKCYIFFFFLLLFFFLFFFFFFFSLSLSPNVYGSVGTLCECSFANGHQWLEIRKTEIKLPEENNAASGANSSDNDGKATEMVTLKAEDKTKEKLSKTGSSWFASSTEALIMDSTLQPFNMFSREHWKRGKETVSLFKNGIALAILHICVNALTYGNIYIYVQYIFVVIVIYSKCVIL